MSKEKKLTNEEIASFFRQTALLYSSGISPRDGMHILLNDCKTESGRKVIKSILDVCMTGESFANAIKASGVFPDYVVHMVTLGEESGNLDSCMDALADFYEKEQAIQENLQSALTYPIVMIVMMLVVIIVLIGKVMPIFEQVFSQLGSEMTGFAATLLKIGNGLNNSSVAILAVLSVFVIAYIFSRYTVAGKKLSNSFLTHFPLTKGFYESVACERFASALSIGMSSGMDTYTGLEMAKKMVDNPKMELKIDECSKMLKEGSNFAEALSESGIFSNLYSQMISVGFRSGNIDTVLGQIASAYEKQSSKKIQTILGILEPTLVIILSVIVGMILLSVILPLMGIMSSIG